MLSGVGDQHQKKNLKPERPSLEYIDKVNILLHNLGDYIRSTVLRIIESLLLTFLQKQKFIVEDLWSCILMPNLIEVELKHNANYCENCENKRQNRGNVIDF